MSVRPLTVADIKTLSEKLAALPLMQRYRRSATALASDWERAAGQGDSLLVFEEGGAPIGIAWFQVRGTLGLGGYLRLLAVSAEGQGRQVGRRLLEAYEETVARASRHTFLLVSDFNREAQRFYEKHGYRQVGRLPEAVLPGVDELIYWKCLHHQ